jgi:hypothetical protein
VPPKSACVECTANKPWEIAEIVLRWPKLADRIIAIEQAAEGHVRTEGLWVRTVKGFRGAIAKPGSMAVFIRRLRADPAELRRYLAMAPPETPPVLCAGEVLGDVPRFRKAPARRAGLREEPLCCFEGRQDPRRLRVVQPDEDLGALDVGEDLGGLELAA